LTLAYQPISPAESLRRQADELLQRAEKLERAQDYRRKAVEAIAWIDSALASRPNKEAGD